MDSQNTGMWVSFFTSAGIPSTVAATYALTFTENRIQTDMLLDLNKEYLRDMGIIRMGDIIAILRHAKEVHENAARDRVLGTTVSSNKVPVAAVAGRMTQSKQPSSPASRILEHYTRKSLQAEAPQVVTAVKRKLTDDSVDVDVDVKKTRLIRFGTPPTQAAGVEVSTSKNTVFSRLGNTEPVKTPSVTVRTSLSPPKAIYSRLGAKAGSTKDIKMTNNLPVPTDALKYEGILKSLPSQKKLVTITASKNNIRKIAMVGTMRADEKPLTIKEKLAISNAKSVKFSSQVDYKVIEGRVQSTIVTPNPNVTQIFNKPERRLSMPAKAVNVKAVNVNLKAVDNSVKARLGNKNANNLTITRNVFNRLGA